MSPNNMPVATNAMPPNTSNRRALMGANVSAKRADTAWVDMTAWSAAAIGSIRGEFVCRARAECRHDALSEQFLRLDAFPAFQTAKIRNNGQLADAALGLQVLDLPDDLLRRADEADFLIHNFVVG